MLKIRLIFVFSLIAMLMSFCVFGTVAEDVTKSAAITVENISLAKITDNSIATHSSGENVRISAAFDKPLEGIYIKFNKSPSKGILNGSEEVSVNGFLHDYIPLDGKSFFELTYAAADICDIQIFSEGELPDSVQLWQKGDAETDILLCATHSDDDQLFFAGLLPYYASYRGLRVRVAYFINHYDTYNRTHELLDGLWHCGVTLYPDISPFPDGYSESVSGAKTFLENRGFSYDDMLDFQRTLLNKYRPLIVVLHDFNGEYGHGAHMLNTKTFIEVCENPAAGQYIPEKIYVHLYGENRLTLDVIDTPLDCFGGKSAFNISQEAFGFHKSQHWTWFYKWIYGANGSISHSSQINKYKPSEYGLYYSSVGADSGINEMTENIETYDDRFERIRLEEQKRLEEQAKLDEQARLEKESLHKAEQLADESDSIAESNKSDSQSTLSFYRLSVPVILAVIAIIAAAYIIRIIRKG